MRVCITLAVSLLIIGFAYSIPTDDNKDFENVIEEVKKTNDEKLNKFGREMTSNGNAEQRSKVRELVLSKYDKMNIPDDPNVSFGATILHIDIDESRRTVESDVWFKMTWTDSRLKWNKEEMGVSHMRFGPDEVWKPDLTLYNSRMNGNAIEQCKDTNTIVYNTGMVLWVPPCHISANCDLTFSRGNVLTPDQNCYFKFGSWTYDGYIMDLNFYNKTQPQMDIDHMGKNSQWRITKNVAELNKKFYSCCKEPYLSINFNFTLSREFENDNCKI